MRVAVFSTKPYDRQFLDAANQGQHELVYFENRLRPESAGLLEGFEAASIFVHDAVTAEVLATAQQAGVGLITLRCAGYNQVDLPAAQKHGVRVARVPAYSPHGVAEFAAGLVMTLNRKYHRAWNRVREANFSLNGLTGFDLRGKTVGVVGTGKIGAAFAQIMRGFGCTVLAHDLYPSDTLTAQGVQYVDLPELFARSRIISLHCPLLESTRNLIRRETLAQMQRGVMLINTSRGGLIDTGDLIDALKSGQVGAVGLDVYEEEEGIFYEDLSGTILPDDELSLLLAYPNVLVTSHQGFFTEEALQQIAQTTIVNLNAFASGTELVNEVLPPPAIA